MWILIALAIVIGFIVLPGKVLFESILALALLAILALFLFAVLPSLLPLLGGTVMMIYVSIVIVAVIVGTLVGRDWFQN